MAGSKKSIEIDFDITTRDAQKNVEALNRELGKTEQELGEAESAGKIMARAIEQSAADMIREIDDTARAVAELETKLDGLDLDPRDVVAGLKSMGLTADEITADADELAAALRAAGDVEVHAKGAGFDDLDQALGKTTEGGKAASAAIGGIGGSISELPGIGSLGPIAESVGQLAEGALEGEVNMKQLGSAIGILGGTAVVMAGVQKVMQSIADTKAFNTEQVEEFRDALEETGDAGEAVNLILEKTGKITGRAGGILGSGILEGTKDVTDAIIDAGVGYQEYIDAVTEGGSALDGAKAKLDDYARSLDTSGALQETNTELWAENVKKAREAEQAIEVLTETNRNYSDTGEASAKTTAWMTDELTNSALAAERAEDNQRRYEAGLRDAEKATDALREANEKLRGDLSKRDAYLNVLDSFDDLKAKGQETWDAVAAGTVDAETAARDYEQQQIAVKQGVLDYIETIGDIPPEKKTEILTLVDQGEYAKAQAQLDALDDPKTVNLDIRMSPQLRAILQAGGDPQVIFGPRSLPPSSSTSPVPLVGVGATAVAAPTQSITNNVYLPRAADARDIDRALARWARTNGPRDD